MTDPGDRPRIYGEKEIGHILKRATELQHAEPAPPSMGGLTLGELEEIAIEAGIDPRHLRRAAMDLDTGSSEPRFWDRVVGERLQLEVETAIPGELPDSGFERVVSVIQRAAHDHGQPSLLGRTLTWRAETPSKTRTIQVVVSVRGGETRIRIEERLNQFAGGLFGGTLGGIGGGIGMGFGIGIGLEVLGSALFAVAFPIGVFGLTFMGAREIYRAVVKSRRRKMAGLLDAISREVTDCIAEAGLGVGDTPPRLTTPGG